MVSSGVSSGFRVCALAHNIFAVLESACRASGRFSVRGTLPLAPGVPENRRKLTPPPPSATDIGLDCFLGRTRSWDGFSPGRWVRHCAPDPPTRGKSVPGNGPARCRWHSVWVGLVFAERRLRMDGLPEHRRFWPGEFAGGVPPRRECGLPSDQVLLRVS